MYYIPYLCSKYTIYFYWLLLFDWSFFLKIWLMIQGQSNNSLEWKYGLLNSFNHASYF